MIDVKLMSIIIPDNGSSCIEYSAKELQEFIFKSVGIKIDIVSDSKKVANCISLGKTQLLKDNIKNVDYTKLKDDGFFIKQIDDCIYIDGNYDLSVLYGVYDFIEKFLGVRFISDDYTYIPKSDGCLEGVIDVKEIPAIDLRAYPLDSMFGETVNPVFMARQRNYNNFTVADKKYGYRQIFYARKQGTHNCIFFISEDEGKRHPEFFGLDDTKHADDEKGFYHDKMLCLTNGITEDGEIDESVKESVAKIVTREMIKDFTENTEAKYFIFDLMDGGVKCNCPKCSEAERKYKRSGTLIRFCNAVAKKVQEYSDKNLGGRKFYLCTIIYSYSAEAPMIEAENGNKIPIDNTVIPNDNVVIRLAVNFNALYSMDDDRQRKHEYDMFNDWSRLTKYMFFWGYDCGFDCLQKYFPSAKNISANAKYLAKRNNVKYVFMDGCKNSADWQCSMRSYAYSKLFWNPNLNADALLDEFIYHYFGELSFTAIKEVIDILQKRCEFAGAIYGIQFRMLQSYKFPQVIDLDTILKVKSIIEKTINNVEENESGELKELHLKHLAQIYCMPQFYLLMDYKYFYPMRSHEDYLKDAKIWVEWCKKGNIVMYHDTFSVKSFIDSGYKFPY